MSVELGSYTLDFGWTMEQFAAPTKAFPNVVAPTTPTVVNRVSIAIAPVAPAVVVATTPTGTTLVTTATPMTVTTVTDTASVALYGEQATPVVVTLLETVADAFSFGEYLIRDVPVFWFTGLGVRLNGLSDAKQLLAANLEIGDQVSIAKTFPNVAGTAVKSEFVEGISHSITPSGHDMVVYCGPAVIYTEFVLDTSTINTDVFGLGI